ncbi:MAG: DUF3108 domain-containing protein [Candidatus Omnitrophica bacterium]|nr:DUF3108 domain-containing protein [Candidatus Omnitrophota bacterium]
MKIIQIILSVICLLAVLPGCSTTGRVRSIKAIKDVSQDEILTVMATGPGFKTRKRLTYLIAWNNIPVGRITAESRGIEKYQGKGIYIAKVVTESNKFLSKIYRVEDTYTSYVDAQTMTSLRYEADRKEGNYRKHLIVEYDFDALEAIYTNLTDGSVKRCKIEKDVQDPLSAACRFTTLPLEPEELISMTINLNEKNYKVYGKIENVNAVGLPHLGTFPAFMLRPYVELNSKRWKKGKGRFYFSADENRYPLYGIVWIPFGRVTATLRSIEDLPE